MGACEYDSLSIGKACQFDDCRSAELAVLVMMRNSILKSRRLLYVLVWKGEVVVRKGRHCTRHKHAGLKNNNCAKDSPVSTVLIAVVMLTACGGGGGGGGSPPTLPDTEPDVVVVPPVDEPEDFKYGISAATGINRIPPSAIVLSPSEVSEFFVITEGYNFGSTVHSDAVMKHICDSYIEQCQWDSDNVPFIIFYGNDSPNIGRRGVNDHFVAMINGHANTRIVSASLKPGCKCSSSEFGVECKHCVCCICW